MPSTEEKNQAVERVRVSNRLGAGEPLGEPAPPPGILERLPDGMRDKLPDELVDELLAGASSEEEIVGPGGLLSQLTKRLVERAMEVELTDHLGYESHQEPPGGAGRNGSTPKTLVTEHGAVGIRTDQPGKRDVHHLGDRIGPDANRLSLRVPGAVSYVARERLSTDEEEPPPPKYGLCVRRNASVRRKRSGWPEASVSGGFPPGVGSAGP
jgi:hypothetical protein